MTSAELAAMKVTADSLRKPDDLNTFEIRELDVIAFAYGLKKDRRQAAARQLRTRALAIQKVARFARDLRETALIASLSTPDATVQPWSGVIGAEGSLTGDGRVIAFGALTWARFPFPLRYVASDVGGHDGAVIVGLVEAVTRGDDGLIRANGVLDLGSEVGREVARLIRAGMLSGISMDLDSTTTAPALVNGTDTAALVSKGRVRAATLVAIPAFDEARISLDAPSIPNSIKGQSS